MGKKTVFLRDFVCDIIRPSKELITQSKLLKHKNKVWKLFRIKNEYNGVVPVSLLLTVNIFQTFLIVCFEQAIVYRVQIEKISPFINKIEYNALCSGILKFINN